MYNSPARVVVVDDDQDWLELVTGILEGEGYVVASAVNGMAAVDVIASFEPCVVITDLAMPVMNGRQLMIALRSGSREIPVIVLSGEETTDVSAVSRDVFRVLTKPVWLDDLLSAVAAARRSAAG